MYAYLSKHLGKQFYFLILAKVSLGKTYTPLNSGKCVQ